jgi:sugar transferase (PEP-CTERM/EpsH1 system associated)
MSDTVRAPIRVMHVVNALSLAGMEHGVIKQVNRLDPTRFAPSICCLAFRREETLSVLDARVGVHELRKGAGRDLSLVPRLAALMRRERVEIVHSHNWQTFFYSVAAAALAAIPLRVHGHHGREAAAAPARQARLSRWLARRVSRLVAVSGNLGRELIEEWGVPAERVTVIPNGVDLDGFAHPGPVEEEREALGLAPEHRVIITVGGLRPVKDFPTLIRAFARVHAERRESRLVIVGGERGGGSQSELEALADSLGVRSAVIFPGVRQDIPRLLALADVYVNSSVFEGMSNTILEAMAASRPVVATDVGGNPELVRDGVTGYLVPRSDPGPLAARLVEVLSDPGLAKALGARGRALVESEHAMARMVTAYEDCYEDLVWRRGLRRRFRPRELAKAAVARLMAVPGRARRARNGERLVVLTYHRVLPVRAALGYALPPMVMPRDEFDAQMAHLSRRYAPLPLGEAAERLARGTLPPRAVVVTFDDGYGDNYRHAFPILRKHGIPATIFVVTGALDRRTPFWWDAVAQAVERIAALGRADADGLPGWLAARLDALRSGGRSGETARAIVQELNRRDREEREATLAALLAAAPAGGAGGEGVLTWAEVREMRRAGIEFGSHTVSHAFLDELAPEEARREIEDSLERLASELGAPTRLFAYPRGRVAEPLRALLREAGVNVAVTTELGDNRTSDDLLALRRLDAGYLPRAGGFDPHVFDAELAGRFERLHAAGRRGSR